MPNAEQVNQESPDARACRGILKVLTFDSLGLFYGNPSVITNHSKETFGTHDVFLKDFIANLSFDSLFGIKTEISLKIWCYLRGKVNDQ